MKALLALVAVVAAIAATPAYAGAHQAQGYRFITDTLGGNGHPRHVQQGYRFITDTLGGNGGPSAVTVPAAPGFAWGDFGIGASAATGALLVLAGSSVLLRRRTRIAL